MNSEDGIKALADELCHIHHNAMLTTPWECEEISQMDFCAMILEILQWYQFGLDEINHNYNGKKIEQQEIP